MLLRCTARLLAVLRPAALASAPPDPDDWYANLLWIEGRKCVLLVHADTLFPVFAADVRAAQLRRIGSWLTNVIGEQLRAEHLPLQVLGALDPDDVQVAKTASRQVLGVMNDLAFQIEVSVADAGGLAGCDLAGLSRQLRRTLYRRDGQYATPIERVTARLPAPPPGDATAPPAPTGPPPPRPPATTRTVASGPGWTDGSTCCSNGSASWACPPPAPPPPA